MPILVGIVLSNLDLWMLGHLGIVTSVVELVGCSGFGLLPLLRFWDGVIFSFATWNDAN